MIGESEPVEVMSFGHFGFYKSIGRTEVVPTPIDKDIYQTGLAYRFGAFPILEPAERRGAGIVREGSVLPGIDDNVGIQRGKPAAPASASQRIVRFVRGRSNE